METVASKRVNALRGLLAVEPALGRIAQRVILRECDAGHVEEALAAVAGALLEEGMRTGEIPPNSGIRAALEPEARAACLAATARYAVVGVLVAKGYVPAWKLCSAMLAQWTTEFAPPIPETRRLSQGMDDEELAARTCVAALCCRNRLEELVGSLVEETATAYLVQKENMEPVLLELLKTAINAFDSPNLANHGLLHSPKGLGESSTGGALVDPEVDGDQ